MRPPLFFCLRYFQRFSVVWRAFVRFCGQPMVAPTVNFVLFVGEDIILPFRAVFWLFVRLSLRFPPMKKPCRNKLAGLYDMIIFCLLRLSCLERQREFEVQNKEAQGMKG